MTSIITNSQERTRFLKFSVVGVIGAIVDFGVMNLLVALFGASLVIAGTISFIAAIFSNSSAISRINRINNFRIVYTD